MELADLFGYAGIFTGVAFMVPQVYKSWKTKSVGDLSWGMIALFFLNCIFWFTYGALLGSLQLMLANGIAFLVSITQIAFKVRYSRSSLL
ncbi:hypothetical protein HYW59_02335 [Candidatus Kaiserbacteria bacterium]|nr:hypothetical protein [Candidatus Kaiserbacteria bacterium]